MPPNILGPGSDALPSLVRNHDAEESDDEFPLRPDSLSDWLSYLSLNPMAPRFQGSSSSLRLVQRAVMVKVSRSGEERHNLVNRFNKLRRPYYWDVDPVSLVVRYEIFLPLIFIAWNSG
jgi:hypothetical protein